jgi:hypothetical protein
MGVSGNEIGRQFKPASRTLALDRKRNRQQALARQAFAGRQPARETWAIDVSTKGGTHELFLRYDPLDPAASRDVFTITCQPCKNPARR